MLAMILPFVRHGLQFASGLLVAWGLADADSAAEAVKNVETIIGAATSLASFVWYVIEKRRAAKAA